MRMWSCQSPVESRARLGAHFLGRNPTVTGGCSGLCVVLLGEGSIFGAQVWGFSTF